MDGRTGGEGKGAIGLGTRQMTDGEVRKMKSIRKKADISSPLADDKVLRRKDGERAGAVGGLLVQQIWHLINISVQEKSTSEMTSAFDMPVN